MLSKYTIISWSPIILLWIIYIGFQIYDRDWETLGLIVLIIIVVFLSYKWFRYWYEKEEKCLKI